jgi:hypothetical protein
MTGAYCIVVAFFRFDIAPQAEQLLTPCRISVLAQRIAAHRGAHGPQDGRLLWLVAHGAFRLS